jgi:Beta-propeller repeat
MMIVHKEPCLCKLSGYLKGVLIHFTPYRRALMKKTTQNVKKISFRRGIVLAAACGALGIASMSRAATLSNPVFTVYSNSITDYAGGSAFNANLAAGNNGTTFVAQQTVGSVTTPNGPQGVVFDSSGNLYYSDNGNNSIYEVPEAEVAAGTGTPQLFASGVTGAIQMAFYGGNLYVAGSVSDNVYQITPAGVVNTYATITGASTQIYGLAIDTSGNVFVSDRSLTSTAGTIYKITPATANTGSYCQK